MVLASIAVIILVVVIFVGSAVQAVLTIDGRTVGAQRELITRLLADYPQPADATPARSGLRIAALAGLESPRVGQTTSAGPGEIALLLPAQPDRGSGSSLIWTPHRAASEVFATLAPYRLLAVAVLVPMLVLLLLKFRAYAHDLERQRRAAHALAGRDSLTGLANRFAFDQRLAAELADGGPDRPAIALLLLDLNDFKHVNDTFGHAAGDAVLAGVAVRLRRMVTPPALAARLGGDEFAVVRPLDDGPDALWEAARDLHTVLAEPYLIDDRTVDVPASIGIALSPEHGTNVDELLRNADAALYRAKAHRDRPFFAFERDAARSNAPMAKAPQPAERGLMPALRAEAARRY